MTFNYNPCIAAATPPAGRGYLSRLLIYNFYFSFGYIIAVCEYNDLVTHIPSLWLLIWHMGNHIKASAGDISPAELK